MNVKEKIKNIISVNPIAFHRRQTMRKNLVNTKPTFLCPNCIGGILFHDLGIQFQSPTVNLMMFQQDFAEFVLHLDDYLERDLIFYKDEKNTCPCAYFSGSKERINLVFTHYCTEEEATQKWKERSKRIDRENLFVFLEERDGLTKEMMLQLGKIRARGLVIFTANSYPDIPYALQIKKYASDGEVGNILAKNILDDSREYEMYFDFVKWFNEANGDFDIKPFQRIPH